jgi:hypothetical protein
VSGGDPEYEDAVIRLIREHHSGRSEDKLEVRHWDRIHKKFYPLAEQVLSYKASTLEGVRLQTRALLVYHNEIWVDLSEDNAEPEQPVMCAFFASLCGVLGLQFPPVPERWQA